MGEKRISQKKLAEKTGIRPNTISELYHELTYRVNLSHIDKICEALDCEIGDLLVRVPDPPVSKPEK